MQARLQNGIFYQSPQIGNSCHIVLIRLGIGSDVLEVGQVLVKLWTMLKNLEKGIVDDLKLVHPKHLHQGSLSVLIGYGPKIFSIKDVKKDKPHDLDDGDIFSQPLVRGGGPIVPGSDIKYAKDVVENDATAGHIILQFVGENEFITSRATYETWKVLSGFQNSQGNNTLNITRIYTGFQRDDKRNWFGFHDGVSNLPSKERIKVISITRNDVRENDLWIVNGSYMAFLRTEFDVDEWNKITDTNQSIIIGRDKITGCPLIGIDKNNQPIKDNRCPVRGTFDVLEKGNEIFREHPPFGRQKYLPLNVSDKLLLKSHIGKSNPTEEQLDRNNSYRIYRQGFEYLEPTLSYPGFRVGLNFISFQKTPKRFLNILKHSNALREHSSTGSDLPSFETFFSVRAAGIFVVPPAVTNEPFPGSSIFMDERAINDVKKFRYYDNLKNIPGPK
jgi:deferrochelatase/peroxidase EfeB